MPGFPSLALTMDSGFQVLAIQNTRLYKHQLKGFGIPVSVLACTDIDATECSKCLSSIVLSGLCPDWETWDPKKPVDNAREAMQQADDWLGVPQVKEQDSLSLACASLAL